MKEVTLELVEAGKKFIVFHSSSLLSNYFPFVSIKVGFTRVDTANFTFIDALYHNADYINVTDLEPFTEYYICIIPIPLFGIYFVEDLCKISSLINKTLEGGTIFVLF